MVVIKEFLADPIGPDTGAEYISLLNNGSTTASLSGWQLKDKSGKTFSLSGYSLPAGKELRLFSSATKITLNNSDETVSLFDASGKLIDELVLAGKAVSGQVTVEMTQLTGELRGKMFDDLAGSTMPASASMAGQVIGFWFITSMVLALAAALTMRTIKDDDQKDQNFESSWNG
jgi:hypothetical protein